MRRTRHSVRRPRSRAGSGERHPVDPLPRAHLRNYVLPQRISLGLKTSANKLISCRLELMSFTDSPVASGLALAFKMPDDACKTLTQIQTIRGKPTIRFGHTLHRADLNEKRAWGPCNSSALIFPSLLESAHPIRTCITADLLTSSGLFELPSIFSGNSNAVPRLKSLIKFTTMKCADEQPRTAATMSSLRTKREILYAIGH